MQTIPLRKKRRSRLPWLAMFGGLCLVICVWIVASRPETQIGISAKCKFVPGSAKMNVLSYGYDKLSNYQWMPDGSLLQIDENAALTAANPLLPVLQTNPQTGATKTSVKIPIKNDNFLEGPGPYLSPDGKWVIHEGFAKLFLISLTGSKTVSTLPIDAPNKINQPCRIYSRAAWMRDGLHWIELSENKHYIRLLVHNLQGSIERKIPVTGPVEYSNLLGITSRNQALLQVFKGPNSGRSSLLEIDLAGKEMAPAARPLKLSGVEKADYSTLVLSRNEDRLVWLTRGNPRARMRFPDILFLKPQTYDYSFWIGDLNTGEARLQETMRLYANQEPYGLNWTPDGKKISFACRKALYTLPVK